MTRRVETPVGVARVHLTPSPRPDPVGTLVLGHGAGGGVEALDLQAARDAALACGLAVALVEQPWRVTGRRVAEAPARLDVAWTTVVGGLDVPGPLVLGGRSSGARVACRTATSLSADAVLALAFPLVAPRGRRRDHELAVPAVARLVVQGERDAFGVPVAGPGVEVHVVRGADHAFAVRRRDGRTADEVLGEVREVVTHWLAQLAQTLT